LRSTAERTASGPTDVGWTTCRGQFYHNSARQSRRRRPALPVPSPNRPRAARQEQLHGKGVTGAQLRHSRGHAMVATRPGRTSRCRAGLSCARTGSRPLRRGPQLPGRRAAGHSSLHCSVPRAAGGMCVRSRQVNFAGLRRTGKNTATAMAHATRTTRLRMTHDGSMRFLERAEAFSLFFFFSAQSVSPSTSCMARSELPIGLLAWWNSHPEFSP
jgi:hypothetical protein